MLSWSHCPAIQQEQVRGWASVRVLLLAVHAERRLCQATAFGHDGGRRAAVHSGDDGALRRALHTTGRLGYF